MDTNEHRRKIRFADELRPSQRQHTAEPVPAALPVSPRFFGEFDGTSTTAVTYQDTHETMNIHFVISIKSTLAMTSMAQRSRSINLSRNFC